MSVEEQFQTPVWSIVDISGNTRTSMLDGILRAAAKSMAQLVARPNGGTELVFTESDPSLILLSVWTAGPTEFVALWKALKEWKVYSFTFFIPVLNTLSNHKALALCQIISLLCHRGWK